MVTPARFRLGCRLRPRLRRDVPAVPVAQAEVREWGDERAVSDLGELVAVAACLYEALRDSLVSSYRFEARRVAMERYERWVVSEHLVPDHRVSLEGDHPVSGNPLATTEDLTQLIETLQSEAKILRTDRPDLNHLYREGKADGLDRAVTLLRRVQAHLGPTSPAA